MEPQSIDRPLPSAPEIEQAVLGTLMIYRPALQKVIDFLTPDMFSGNPNANIYRAILALDRMGAEPNILTVTQWLRNEKLIEATGGAGYVSLLTNKVSNDASIDYHARVVQQKYILRRLIFGAEATKNAAYCDNDCFDVLDIAEQSISDCRENLAPNAVETGADEGSNLVDGIRPPFLRFNTPELCDRAMFQSGLIHTFGGRTGMGKSIMSTEEAWGWTNLGRVLMFSPEMTKRQVTARILSRESGVPYTNILFGKMDTYEQDLVAQTWHRISDRLKKLIIDPTSAVTPSRVSAVTKRMMKDGIVAVVIDHLHDMSTGIPRIDSDPSGRPRVAYCITQLNEIAKSTNLPFMVMAQLNREVESRTDRRPKISDLLWAGEIEQKSAVIGLLYRQGYYEPEPPWNDTLEISIAKNRDGGVTTCKAPITPALSLIGQPTKIEENGNAPF